MPLPARPRRTGPLARLGPPARVGQQLREPAGLGQVREVPAAWPDGDLSLGQQADAHTGLELLPDLSEPGTRSGLASDWSSWANGSTWSGWSTLTTPRAGYLAA